MVLGGVYSPWQLHVNCSNLSREKSCLNCYTSLPRRKASILASIFRQNHLWWFFRPRQTSVYLTTTRGHFFPTNLNLFHHLHKNSVVHLFFYKVWVLAVHFVCFLYETIPSAFSLEGGEGSMEQMERREHHQFNFPPATRSNDSNSVSLLISCCLGG